MRIFIIGPGGAGKTTCGKILAEKLNFEFIDLDDEFIKTAGDISKFIYKFGYDAYCRKNTNIFMKLLRQEKRNSVFALSSGFLIYDKLGEKNQRMLANKGTTILLLPSKSLEKSIKIIVKRQLKRGFGLKESKEREKIIERHPQYKIIGDIRIFSDKTPIEIADQMYHEFKKSLL